MHLDCTVLQRGRRKHTLLIAAENKRFLRVTHNFLVTLSSTSTSKCICSALSAADAALQLFKIHISVCSLCSVQFTVWFPISSTVMGKKRHLQEMECCVSYF